MLIEVFFGLLLAGYSFSPLLKYISIFINKAMPAPYSLAPSFFCFFKTWVKLIVELGYDAL